MRRRATRSSVPGRRLFLAAALGLFAWILPPATANAADASAAGDDFLAFIRAEAESLRRDDRSPENAGEWRARKTALRKQLAQIWGDFPPRPAPPKTQKVGELKRDGYTLEKLLIETFPDVWMTANLYFPHYPDKTPHQRPALLMVHGHWRGAKQDPVVQSRCIGAVKLGFVVLVVDAFGAGERGIGRALGEYHGDMTAATLFPIGLPLSGIQVFENMRAVDYLQTRPEVEPTRIGISGASGGGNQSMYAGAWDERLAAVVPVCSMGNYQAYLGAACCMCEVVPGALKFTEEWAILGLVAPRALMVINATRDSRQFSVPEAKISLRQTQSVYDLLQKPDHLRHTTFESGHDYSQPMREAVYGWMTLHLKGEGNGDPIPEPSIMPESPEELRCFPGESRPADWMTIPKFAAAQARRLVAKHEENRKSFTSVESWNSERSRLRKLLEHDLLGGFPEAKNLSVQTVERDGFREITFSPEPGIVLTARQQRTPANDRVLILIDLEGAESAAAIPEAKQARAAGWSVVTMDLRSTGKLAKPSARVGRAPDHTTSQWALWIGRPMLGQWAFDIRRFLDALHELDGKMPQVALFGTGPGGVVALAAAALDDRITRVATDKMLASYITEVPYEQQRVGIIVPGILKHFGDIADLAALVAPRPLHIQSPVAGNAKPLSEEALEEIFRPSKKTYSVLKAENLFHLTASKRFDLAQFLSP